MPLNGKVALVTGGSRGIGRAIALRLARDGALVAVGYSTSEQSAADVVNSIVNAGGVAFAVQADLGDMSAIDRLVQKMDEQLTSRGGNNAIDILVNNAAVAETRTIDEMTEDFFDRHVAVNMKGTYFLTKHVLKRINDGGRIINISSGTTNHILPQFSVYSMCKSAMNHLTMSLAKQYGPRGITVNAVGPGVVDTEINSSWLVGPTRQAMIDCTVLGRIGLPDDIAGVVAFLASKDAGWVTGQYIEASGGILL